MAQPVQLNWRFFFDCGGRTISQEDRADRIRMAAEVWFTSNGFISQAELAKRMGVSQPTICYWQRSDVWKDHIASLEQLRQQAMHRSLEEQADEYKQKLEIWKSQSESLASSMIAIETLILAMMEKLVSETTSPTELQQTLKRCEQICRYVGVLGKMATSLHSAATISFDQVLGVREILKLIERGTI